jgi:hypothetical protein
MSTTTSDPAASVLAAALRAEAAAASMHRRFHLGRYLGVEPEAVFAELMDGAGETITIDTLATAGELRAVGIDGVALIPYLVAAVERAASNRGSQGFAAALRSHFASGADSQPRVLLILDANPVETVSTASEDAAALPELAWSALCRRAAEAAEGGPAEALAAQVAKELTERMAPSGEALAHLAAFAARSWRDEAEAGAHLHELGLYLSDPAVGGDLPRRLKAGRDWRSRLDSWAVPSVDLAKSLRRKLGGETRAVRKVQAAVGPFGIDYSQFTLDDLSDDEPLALSFARPLIVRGAAAALKGGDGDRRARYGAPPRLVAWFREPGGSLRLRLAGELEEGDRGEIRWRDGDIAPLALNDDGREASASIEGEGWRFGRAVLERGSAVLDAVDIAVYIAGGTWFPIERALLLDLDEEAFIVESEPAALAIAPAGGVLGPVALEDAPEPGERAVATASGRQGERHPLPLLLLGEGPEFGGDGTGEDDETEDEEELGEEDGEPPAPEREAASPVHALLEYAARAESAPTGLSFHAEDGKGDINAGGDLYQLAAQDVAGLSGLEIEAAILARPEHWAFTAVARPEGVDVLPDATLERLAPGSIPAPEADAFRAARAAFFGAVAPSGSVYAAGTGAAEDEAVAYVEAFAALLAAIPERRYQAEFDRLLLMDAVTVPETDEMFLAPTNPVTVAFYLAFAEAARAWAQEAPRGLLAADLAAISPGYLMPLVLRGGDWYEVAAPSPFLWRRYQVAGDAGAAVEQDGRAVATRLDFFLDVYPAYADKDQWLTIAVHEPGDGTALVDALRRFYRRDLREAEYTRPRLDISLISDSSELPAAVHALLAGGEENLRPERISLNRLVRSRIKVSVRPRGEQPFSHLTFVFRTPAAREPAEVDMAERATSLYVGGLAAAPGRIFLPGANYQSFSWGTFAAAAGGAPARGRAAELLPPMTRDLLNLVGAQPNALLTALRTRMPSTTIERGFMPEIYGQSVWVVHLDHLLGLEAFSPDGDHARYLIDYEERPDSSHAGLSAVTATQRVEPYLDALSGALHELGTLTDEALTRILRLLNSVSGRWALQILRQSREQILERIGTVTAIAAVEELDLGFSRLGGAGLVLPLDELSRILPARGLERPQATITDDLLYLWLPYVAPEEPLRVGGRLLEVKYRSRARPNLAMARQEIENTHEWLERVFNDQGPGRLFRARDLAELMRSAASRAVAFRLMPRLDDEARAQFEAALGRVASGDYELDLSFWVGDERLIGDVISVELESDSGAVRSALPGGGEPAGLVRLGRQTLAALATGHPLPAPEDRWQVPRFSPPDGGTPAEPPAPEPAGGPASEGPRAQDEAPVRDQEAPAATAPAAAVTEVSDEVRQLARALDAAVLKYDLDLEPFQPALAQVGPSVIRFRARPLGSQSLEGVSRRAADIGREIGVAEGVLVGQEPYYITIDVPRREREVIRFSDYSHLLGERQPGALKFLVGMAASGEVTVADLARLPHLLIAGATGSGKSVFLRSLMCSLLEQHGAMDLSILLVDPKQLDFLPFEDLPHLVDGRIIFDPGEAVALLGETIDREIERRRPLIRRAGVSNVLEFYEAGGSTQELPQMVIVVDEFADLASTMGRGERAEFMNLIQRYGQMTRAYGIYLVLATQRPSVQVITGDIKANLTARVALKVQAPQDSVTILGHGGAESLRDKGDLLFEHGGRSERLQGFMVTPQDVAMAVGRWSRP